MGSRLPLFKHPAKLPTTSSGSKGRYNPFEDTEKHPKHETITISHLNECWRKHFLALVRLQLQLLSLWKKKSKKSNNLNKTHGRLLLFLRLGSKWQDHINSLSDDLTFVAKMFDEHVLENFHAGFESVFFIVTQSFANDILSVCFVKISITRHNQCKFEPFEAANHHIWSKALTLYKVTLF